jgi:formylglycine-generating enzyme required for sulfatase activity
VLTVTASVTDGGTLTYQWYSNDTDSDSGGSPVGTNSSSFTPPTTSLGTIYYYVEVTNTIPDNGDGGDKTATATSNTASITVFITLPTGIEMVWIPAGSFQMGSNDSLDRNAQPAHQVTLTNGFWMGKYQVTQGQWHAVMGNWPSFFDGTNDRSHTTVTPTLNRNNLPVESVSWYDAIVFCNRLSMMEGLTPAYEIPNQWPNPTSWTTDPVTWGAVPTGNTRWNAVRIVSGSNGYRLPTEAQWEYACRAGTTTAYNTGYVITDDTGWYFINSGNRTREVGLKPANSWGLHDKHGNVREWCWDRWGSYTDAPKTDPTGPTAGGDRVLRGGGWDSNGWSSFRSAGRLNYWPYDRSSNIGFRLSRP